MLNLPRYVDALAGRPESLWPGNGRRPAVRRVVYTNRPRAESPTPDHSCQGPMSERLRGRQLGNDLVAIAAVDRVDELECPAARIAARALEEEGGRMERYLQRGRLLLVRHGWLDRLRRRRDLYSIPRTQELVKRAFEIP